MTEPIKQSDFDKALALLPWYAKGQLSPDENNWIGLQLKNSTSLQNELNLIKKQISITEAYVDNINVKEFENQKDRLSALQRRINTVAHSGSAVHNKSDKNNLWAKLLSFLPQTQSSWKTAGALALSIMVIQGVVISQLYRAKPNTTYTTLSEGEPEANTQESKQISFLTRFNLNASIYEVDNLLNEYHLSIISGPDAGGIYQLRYVGDDALSDAQIENLIAELEEQDKIIRFIARNN